MDTDNEVRESDENDNCSRTERFRILPLGTQPETTTPANITVTNVRLNSANPMGAGATMSMGMTVCNTGGVLTGQFKSHHRLIDANGNVITLADDTTGPLNLGQCEEETIQTWVSGPSTPGNYMLQGCGDALGQVPESNEGDNCQNGPTLQVIDNRPDLIVPYLELLTGVSYNPSGAFRAKAGIKNIGLSAPTANHRGAYQWKKRNDSVWTTVEGDTTEEGKPQPNQTEWEEIFEAISAPTEAGDYDFRFCADNSGTVSETDEGNNCSNGIGFTVNPPPPSGPDLVIERIWIAEGTSFKSGSNIHPHCIVKNVGTQNVTADSILGYYVDGDFDDDDRVDWETMCVGCSEHEEVKNDDFDVNTRGTRTLMCCADIYGAVQETNETNNCKSMTFTVY